jgi:hypothetical protein
VLNKTRLKVLTGALIIGVSAALSTPAFAASETMMNLLSILRDKGSISQDEYNALVNAAQNEAETKKEAAPKGWWDKTKISGRMYYDMSYINNKREGVKQSNSGVGFDIKRFYVSIDHQFTDMFSADVTTDFTYDSNVGATQLFIKKAYLEAKISDALDIRLGSTDLPWVPFVEGLYGHRYVENIMIDRTKFGTSADWGLHFKGKLAGGMLNYALSVINGSGYKHPGVHTNTMDFEGRVSANWNHFVLGLGGYVGKLGADKEGVTTFHTAKRLDVIAAYVDSQIRAGVEYFRAWDFKNVSTPVSDTAEGVSGFASYQFNPLWSVFGRYDYVKPTKDTNSSLKDNYFNVGVTYTPARIVDFSLVYKRDRISSGSWGTSNGTIGGLTATTGSGTYDEVGLFSRFRW